MVSWAEEVLWPFWESKDRWMMPGMEEGRGWRRGLEECRVGTTFTPWCRGGTEAQTWSGKLARDLTLIQKRPSNAHLSLSNPHERSVRHWCIYQTQLASDSWQSCSQFCQKRTEIETRSKCGAPVIPLASIAFEPHWFGPHCNTTAADHLADENSVRVSCSADRKETEAFLMFCMNPLLLYLM